MSRGGSRDQELSSFLSRVEQLDSERTKKKPSVKPKPKNLKYNDDDYEKAENLLSGSYKNKPQYDTEIDRAVSSLAYKSAYNYDKTFSPKKNGSSNFSARNSENGTDHLERHENLGNDTRRISKFDDVYKNAEPSKGEFVVSKEDYEMLMQMKMKGDRVDSRPDFFPSRGSARKMSGNEEDLDFRVHKSSGPNSKPKAKPTPKPKPKSIILGEYESPDQNRGHRLNGFVRDTADNEDVGFNDKKPLSLRIGGSSDRKKKNSLQRKLEEGSDDEINLKVSGPVFSSRNFKDHDDIAQHVANDRRKNKVVPPPPAKRNSTKSAATKYKIVDEDPVDEFSEVFQKIRLTNADTNSKPRWDDMKHKKTPPKKPAKKPDLYIPKLNSFQSTRPSLKSNETDNSDDDDKGVKREEREVLAIRRTLRKTQTAPSRRDITPEAVKAKSTLKKPSEPEASISDIPEAIARRQALLRSSTQPELEKKSSFSLKSLQKQSSNLQKQLLKTLNGSQASLPSVTSPAASTANSSSDSLVGKGKTLPTKVRSKGPKRKLPTEVTKL
ncbi:unnamed protein product [Kluyveromyces dobzhanskii CBS 2104]|uniref:WGS project CCBQ000000000 data, contig 00012 n=1 Tax=Kluyveromyces dobzhanskii CBS 2104 TaxID=1427455 RepID=A0A0A8L2Z7_9SACH|nr:unnamed protein product [Kluyveromyces dobzhanskii CBS 2104]